MGDRELHGASRHVRTSSFSSDASRRAEARNVDARIIHSCAHSHCSIDALRRTWAIIHGADLHA
eukprot:1989878-Pleurochrysis_carterae.AAC.2